VTGTVPRARIVEWPASTEEQRALIANAVALIQSGEVVAFPTDTVYGIGVHAWNQDAVRRLYDIKERPAHKAIALLLSRLEQMADVTDSDTPALRELAGAYWPGPLTVVVPWNPSVEEGARQPFSTVGVRVPDHPVALALISAVGTPLATTSANLSGAPSAVSAQEVARQIGDRVALIIDGGLCPGGRDSSVVDLTTSPPTVRRVGAVPVEDLTRLIGPLSVEV
jgi:L-threonylcarbamoyladenylate synthase